jgi:UDP-3-O-[3-hydroxymyristoyl] glucosamine N-acyltransferase
LEDGVEIGSNCTIDRAKLENTVIGAGTKLDNFVHIAHNSQLGKNNIICAGAIIGGSVTTGDNCFIGLNATIKDHVRLGDNVTVGCGANVVKDVQNGETVFGNPAKAKAVSK